MMLEMLREFGPAVAAIAFFIWRDWKREERTMQMNSELNIFIRTELNQTLRENTAAIMRMVQHCAREDHD